MKTESQFMSCGNKGFEMSFPNGWTISVQFGPLNYAGEMQFPSNGWSLNEVKSYVRAEREVNPPHQVNVNAPMQQKNETWSAEMAEISAWHTGSGTKWDFGDDTVQGWQSTTEVLEFINMIASL